jgi:catalase
MPSSPKAPPSGGNAVAAKAAARATDSGPAALASGATDDAAVVKALQTNDLVAAMPFNPGKPGEHGFANGVAPQAGSTAEPASRLVTASTLSEETLSEKVGSVALEGRNATIEPLDRVRVDSTGQVLTTNQGVKVADNQNSLKYGVRGPALLEDFILREKLTTSTTNGSPSASSMRAARRHTASLSATGLPPT